MLGWLELICPTAWACLLMSRPGVLSTTLSHMWDKLNLPIFLLKVGLFTQINIDSLIYNTIYNINIILKNLYRGNSLADSTIFQTVNNSQVGSTNPQPGMTAGAQALKLRLAALSPRQSALPRQVTPLPGGQH